MLKSHSCRGLSPPHAPTVSHWGQCISRPPPRPLRGATSSGCCTRRFAKGCLAVARGIFRQSNTRARKKKGSLPIYSSSSVEWIFVLMKDYGSVLRVMESLPTRWDTLLVQLPPLRHRRPQPLPDQNSSTSSRLRISHSNCIYLFPKLYHSPLINLSPTPARTHTELYRDTKILQLYYFHINITISYIKF
jgi:hypothetical protein